MANVYTITGSPYGYTNALGPASSPPGTVTPPTTPANPYQSNAYTSLLNQYNTVGTPRTGQGAYGLVPAPTPIPPSTYTQFQTADPGLAAGNDQINANIMSELSGQLSPQVMANLQNAAAAYGVSSGMPGSNAVPGSLAFNQNLLGNINETQLLQQQGLQNAQNQQALVAGEQLNPALIANINEGNNALAAAPDPTTAANTALANYYAALNLARGPGGGTSGPGLSPAGGTGADVTGLGFGGAGNVGNAQGFGFGNFGGTVTSPVSVGQGYGGVPGGPAMAFNPETGEYQDVSQNNFGLGSPDVLAPTDTSGYDFTDPSNWLDFGSADTGDGG